MIEVTAPVAAKARAVGAARWLAELPDLVGGLAHDWSLELGPAYPDATEAYVASATRADGTAAVLKVLIPRDEIDADHEITVLRLAGGDGCVRLYEADEQRGAMLLERLGPSLYELQLPLSRRLEILCDVAARIWRPAADAGLPSGADKAQWLARSILEQWEALDRPCSGRAIAHALDCAERRRRAHDPQRSRLVHGDVHQWNALQHGDGFALVDPDGLFADPEYDLGVIMREDPVELLRDGPRARAAWLAERTGCDETALWEWGVVERVSTGLLTTAIGLQPIDRQMLHAADVIAAAADVS
jgi:streptomycin 6-kinase